MSGPLSGKTVVVTRAREQARALGTLLESRGADVLYFPTIAIADPTDWTAADEAVAALAEYRWCVFTSVNAVDRFMDRLAAHHLGARSFCSVQVVAVGPATARRLVERGLHPDLIPADHRAEGLVAALVEEGVSEGDRVLLPRALHAREHVPDALRTLGATVDIVPVYRTIAGSGDAGVLERLLLGDVDAVTFTSSSTARNFVSITEGTGVDEVMDGTIVACIGPVTSDTARGLGFDVSVMPETYTVPALVDALEAAFA